VTTSRKPLQAGSQADLILADLVSGKAVDPMQALRDYQCWRLSGRILDLRRRGHRIVTTIVTKRGKSFAAYTLKGRH
jgi:hypothetical protein